jgi:uncharacterized protein
MDRRAKSGPEPTKTILGAACLVVICVVMLSLWGPRLSEAQKTTNISIAAGGTGGVWYPYGGAMASVISKYAPDIQATAEVTAASVDNARLVGVGKSELALMLGDVGYDAYMGRGVFKARIPMRNIAALYASVTHIVCVDGKEIGRAHV